MKKIALMVAFLGTLSARAEPTMFALSDSGLRTREFHGFHSTIRYDANQIIVTTTASNEKDKPACTMETSFRQIVEQVDGFPVRRVAIEDYCPKECTNSYIQVDQNGMPLYVPVYCFSKSPPRRDTMGQATVSVKRIGNRITKMNFSMINDREADGSKYDGSLDMFFKE